MLSIQRIIWPLAAKAVLEGMGLENADGEAPQPTQIVAQRTLAGAAFVLAKRHILHPRHRLDAPMSADGFTNPRDWQPDLNHTSAASTTHCVGREKNVKQFSANDREELPVS